MSKQIEIKLFQMNIPETHRPMQSGQHVESIMAGCTVGISTDVASIGTQRPIHVHENICKTKETR